MTDSSHVCALLTFCGSQPGVIQRDFESHSAVVSAVGAAFHDAAQQIVVYLPLYLLNFKLSVLSLYHTKFCPVCNPYKYFARFQYLPNFSLKICLTKYQPVEYNQQAGMEA